MNADEKAVAECYGPIVKCSLGKSGDNRLICSCSGCHSHWMAMTLAARIRADAERETAAALARAERAETLVREAGVMLKQREFDRGDGVTIWCGDCGTEARPHLSICPYAALLARIAELEKP